MEAEARRLYAADWDLLTQAGERWPRWEAADAGLRDTYRRQAAYLLLIPDEEWRHATGH